MRVVALFAILGGFMLQLMPAGTPFATALFGVFCGITAIACGLASAQQDPPHRAIGRGMAGLGVLLAIICLTILPSAYREQKELDAHRAVRIPRRSRPPQSNEEMKLSAKRLMAKRFPDALLSWSESASDYTIYTFATTNVAELPPKVIVDRYTGKARFEEK